MNCRANDGRHGIAQLVCGHAIPCVVFVDHVLVHDFGRLLFHFFPTSCKGVIPEELGDHHGRQDVGLPAMARQSQEELRLSELIIHAHGHPFLGVEVRQCARQVPQGRENFAVEGFIPTAHLW